MRRRFWWFLGTGGTIAVAIGLVGLLAGCQGKEGPAGPSGAPGTSTGTLSGKVTNSLVGRELSGASVSFNPAVKDAVTTSGTGDYTVELPIGRYTVTYSRNGFTSSTQDIAVVAGQTTKKDVALVPAKPVAVNAGADVASSPGASVTLRGAVEALDGSTVTSYSWTQTAGPSASIGGADTSSASAVLASEDKYREHFLEEIGRVDRWVVQSINPFELEEGELATFELTVKTSSGTYKDSVNVTVKLPYAVSLGIRNVPIGVPVLLNGKVQPGYSWSVSGPSGTKATLSQASTRNPSFTPDVVGKYLVTETTSKTTIEVFAGTWSGAITGLDAKGLPLTEGCNACHNGTVAPNAQFVAWRASGHAEIFTQNINNPSGHWSLNCASCHTVGYDPDAANGGFDEAMASENWQVPPQGQVGLYGRMFQSYPKTAGLANIQCENCHGPNNGNTLHPNAALDAARISVSSDVCGVCHGEPLRHGRFQQWEDSRHAGTDTTPARGVNNSHCGRCHSAQGFLAWVKQSDLTLRIQGARGNATTAELEALGMGADKIEAVTCVTCHDPHAQGTTSGEPTTATVRVIDDTKLLPAGFQATSVGKGALCMTCHNTRNALHNVDNLPTSYSAPHTSSQGDVLMGQNAYFVSPGQRSPHSYIQDTCVTCHMESTPPPAEFSYNRSGTNHTFRASLEICGDCHSATLKAKSLQAGVHEKIEELAHEIAAYTLKKLPAAFTVKDYTVHAFGGKNYDLLSNNVAVSKSNIVSIEPTEPHGQQGFIIHLKDAIAVTYAPSGEDPHTMSLKELEVRLGDITSDGTKTIFSTGDVLVQAMWNFFLIEADGSFGVHNPVFSVEVIEASIAALK